MGESFIASVQYGDLKGTAAADGHEAGGPLHDLAKIVPVKKGYWPVGFGLNQLYPLENGKLPIVVFAVDARKMGVSANEIQAYANQHGELSVTGFRGEIDPKKFESIFKRFSLRLHSRWRAITESCG